MFYLTIAEPEVCPYGTQSDLPEDKEIFDVEVPSGNPDDVLEGSLDVQKGDKIKITMADDPESFFLVNLKYDSTAKTRVKIVKKDGTSVSVNVCTHFDIS